MIKVRRQEMSEMFETPVRMKPNNTNPFVVMHMLNREKSGRNNQTFKEFSDDVDYTVRRRAHLYKLKQIKERENQLEVVKNNTEKKLKDDEGSSDESVTSVHRPYSGGKLGKDDFQKFNKKFFNERKVKNFEKKVKTLTADPMLLGELLIQDVAVDANPELRA
jgi:hypothetical protein